MQEGGGDTAFDASGRGIHCPTANSPSWVVGAKGRALRFAKASNHSATSTALLPALAAHQHAAISTWIRTTQADEYIGVVSRYDGNTGILLEIHQSEVRYIVGGIGAGTKGSISIDDGAWHHVVVQRSAGYGYIYVDGRLDISAYNAIENVKAVNSCVARLGWYGSTGSDYDGDLLSAVMYNRALAPSEIAQLYADPWAMGTLRRRVFPAAAAGEVTALARIIGGGFF
jgi:hypothetical protein